MPGREPVNGMVWFKHMADMHCNHKIRALRRVRRGNDYAFIFTMLLEIAARCDAGGGLFLTAGMPYTMKTLAGELGYSERTVAGALEALEAFGLVSREDGLRIAAWNEYQTPGAQLRAREDGRRRAAAFRERKRAASLVREASESGTYDAEIVACGVENEVRGGADETPHPAADCLGADRKHLSERREVELFPPLTNGKDAACRFERLKKEPFTPAETEGDAKYRFEKPDEESFTPAETGESGKRGFGKPDDEVFTPPDVEEVKKYREERKSAVDAERFVDYYASVGWKVGKNHMRDWKAAFRRWESPGGTDGGGSYGGAPYQERSREKNNPALDYPQRVYDDDEFSSGDYMREAEEFMKRSAVS